MKYRRVTSKLELELPIRCIIRYNAPCGFQQMGEIAIKHHNAEKFSDLLYKNNRKNPIDVALEQQPNRCRND